MLRSGFPFSPLAPWTIWHAIRWSRPPFGGRTRKPNGVPDFSLPKSSWGFQWKTQTLHWTTRGCLGVSKPGYLRSLNPLGRSKIRSNGHKGFRVGSGHPRPRISVGKLGECLKGVDPTQLRNMPERLKAMIGSDKMQTRETCCFSSPDVFLVKK